MVENLQVVRNLSILPSRKLHKDMKNRYNVVMLLGKYQHSQTGNFYCVIGVAKHSETLEEFVVYECLYENPKNKLWVRPKKMFLEKVEINGKKVPRFKFAGE